MRKIDISELIDFIDASFMDNDVDYITSSWVSSEEIMEEACSNANLKKLSGYPDIIKEYHHWLKISSYKDLYAFVGIKPVYYRDIDTVELHILMYLTDIFSEEDLKQMIVDGIKDFEENVVIKTLDDVLEEIESRKQEFKEHYDNPIVSPQLRWNKKYKTTELENYTPIIAINDLVERNYVVCAIPNEKVEFMLMHLPRTDKVIAEYSSLEEMVNDGWRMGS
jgi:hypothetical protein